ncbi:MAG: OsmC family protein [Ignavibacteriales bacterium]|nr:OsmC family protein [Ignavibacteriales bacterium]
MAKEVFLKQAQGTTFVGKANSGHWVVVDNSIEEGGSASGTSPKELLLISLAACTASDVIPILKKKRSPVEGFQLKAKANEREEFPRIFTDIHLEYIFYGNGIKEKDVEHAIELSRTKYCSVSAMLSASAKITHSYRIELPQTS